MRILITGANGTLGRYVQNAFKDHALLCPDKIYLDIRNYDQAMSFAKHKPDFIMHLAAATDHIACEFSPSDAYFMNTIGTANLVELAKKIDIPILYVSTCGLFDGKKGGYYEGDIPNPINHYSRSKYYGELICRQYPKHIIYRTGWLMGGGIDRDRKFIGKICRKIREGHRRLYAINDVFGSPTYAKDLSARIYSMVFKKLLNESYGNTYHCSNNGQASRLDVAYEVLKHFGWLDAVELIALSYDQYYKMFPQNCHHTKNEVCRTIIKMPMRGWKVALNDYLRKEFKNVTERISID